MFKAVKFVSIKGKLFNWENYLARIVKSTSEKCQETSSMISYSSLRIWMEMYKITLVNDPSFTANSGPNMNEF